MQWNPIAEDALDIKISNHYATIVMCFLDRRLDIHTLHANIVESIIFSSNEQISSVSLCED